LHSPKSSPSAASKPAETKRYFNVVEKAADAWTELTYNKIWRKLGGDGHHDLLKRPKIFSIAHSFCRPRNIDRAASSVRTPDQRREEIGLTIHIRPPLPSTSCFRTSHLGRTFLGHTGEWKCIIPRGHQGTPAECHCLMTISCVENVGGL
jgi:hypothetical protein